jgi:hypothetical protein
MEIYYLNFDFNLILKKMDILDRIISNMNISTFKLADEKKKILIHKIFMLYLIKYLIIDYY